MTLTFRFFEPKLTEALMELTHHKGFDATFTDEGGKHRVDVTLPDSIAKRKFVAAWAQATMTQIVR
jgi:hypothetical protein